jgi:hypothetical protein
MHRAVRGQHHFIVCSLVFCGTIILGICHEKSPTVIGWGKCAKIKMTWFVIVQATLDCKGGFKPLP